MNAEDATTRIMQRSTHPKAYDTKNYCEHCQKFYPGKKQKLCQECGQILRYKPRISKCRNRDYVRY